MYTLVRVVAMLAVCVEFSGCAPPGYVYDQGSFVPRPRDTCLRPEVAGGLVKFLNAEIGKRGGPPEEVVSIEGLVSSDGRRNDDGSGFSCYGTLQLKSGKNETGTVVVVNPGGDSPLSVSWESDPMRDQRIASEAESLKKLSLCTVIGKSYEIVAAVRDVNLPPETALQSISFDQIPLKQRKEIVNKVYFDSSFVNAGGAALNYQMKDICLHGKPNFIPLK